MAALIRGVAGARFSCQGCGFCCRFHQLGPLSPAWVAGLGEPGSWWPPAREGFVIARGGALELRKVDGHCVFLGEDQRCAIHARLGAAAKPDFCRLFPYQLVEDPDGIAITLRDSCGGRAGPGAPVQEAAAEALALAAPAGGVERFRPAELGILPGWTVDLPTWMSWEARLLALLPGLARGGAETDGPGLVCWVRDHLAAWAGLPPFPPEPARARLAARAALAALEMTLDQVQRSEAAPSPAEAAFVDQLQGRVQAAGAALARGEDPPWSPGSRAYLRALLADELLGKSLHRLGSVGAGLGRFLVTAQVAAFAAGPQADAPAFATVHSRLARFTQNRSMHAVLRKAAPALVDMVRFA